MNFNLITIFAPNLFYKTRLLQVNVVTLFIHPYKNIVITYLPSAMDKFSGKYLFVSQDNFGEYLKADGMNSNFYLLFIILI